MAERSGTAPRADRVFRGGVVRTLAGRAPDRAVEALAVSAGKVVALGDAALDLVGAGTEVVDLEGGALLPGFQDAHVHPVLGGLQQLRCDLSELHDLDAYRAAVSGYAARHPELPWVEGSGWYGDVFPGGFPDRHELDRLVPDRPAVLVSHDAHGVWVNGRALDRAGITARTPDPDGGGILRDACGEPTGMLVEAAADLVLGLCPPPDRSLLEAALRQAQAYLHGLGITAWQDAAVGEALGLPDTFDLYRRAEDEGWLTGKVTGALWWQRDAGLGQVEEMVHRRDLTANGRFRATAVKIMQDGVCENLTAAVLEAYTGHPDNHGLSFLEPDELRAAVVRLDAERFDIHLHAVGDRAVRECLDAVEASGAAGWDHRHQLAHLDLVDPADARRMSRLGVIANVQPLWARCDPVLVETKLPYLSPEQQRHHFAFGSLMRGGVPLAMGSDWPVSSPDPLWGVHTAVNRTAPAGDPHARDDRSQQVPLLPDESLDVTDALRAYTVGAARANRRDDGTGTLEPGRAADLVVLDRDPLALPPEELSQVRVRATYVDGGLVHRSP